MSAHGSEPPVGEDRTHGGGVAAAGDGSGALSKAWSQAEHCLPLDDVVRREVWEGSIPIRIELAKQDVCDFEQPMPFYLQVASLDRVPVHMRGLPRCLSRPARLVLCFPPGRALLRSLCSL